ncbi:hypothetical protein L484_000309 [Morus notabilis]|nr:hypothetical protein L484_000309 [Morus notabilis]
MEELDLLLRPLSRTGLTLHYRLPKAILKAQSLTLLKLEGLKMESPLQVCLPFLKLLSLKDVGGLNDHSLEDLLANCPSLEKLVLQDCKDLSAPRVSSSSLKSSEVQLVPRQKIKIEAINLRSLLFTGAQYCRISLATTCAGLESLSLYNVEFLGRCLADYIFKHTLESLTIGGSIGWNDVKNIRSPRLKNLIISQRLSKEAGAVKVDAVNLVSFTYKAHRMKKFCDISLNSPNLRVCNVKLTSQYRIYDTNWYVNLMRLLSDVSCSKNMCLDVYYEEALIIPNELRSICRSSLLAVEHLKVTTYSRLSKMSDLKDSLYWLSPSLKSLSMEQQKNGFHF